MLCVQSWWPSAGLAPLCCCLDLGSPKLVTVFERQSHKWLMEAVITPLYDYAAAQYTIAFFIWGYAADVCSAHPLGPPLFVGLLSSHFGAKSTLLHRSTTKDCYLVLESFGL